MLSNNLIYSSALWFMEFLMQILMKGIIPEE